MLCETCFDLFVNTDCLRPLSLHFLRAFLAGTEDAAVPAAERAGHQTIGAPPSDLLPDGTNIAAPRSCIRMHGTASHPHGHGTARRRLLRLMQWWQPKIQW